MKKFLLLTLVGTLTMPISGYAQSPEDHVTASLEDRLYGCMEDTDCPAPLKLQLLNELYVGMGTSLHKITASCLKKNYESCIDQGNRDVRDWHQIADRMQDLMASMEGPASLIAKGDKKK